MNDEGVKVSLAKPKTKGVPSLIKVLKDKKRDVSKEGATALKTMAQHYPNPALRSALPILRQLRKRDPAFQEAEVQIEAATSVFKGLPVPAAVPPPDARTLPRPAGVPANTPALMPQGLWVLLRWRLKGS